MDSIFIFVLQVAAFFSSQAKMITTKTRLWLLEYVTGRMAFEASFSVSDDFLIEKFGLSRPFWDELNDLARMERLPFVFNGHYYVSIFIGDSPNPHLEPTQIVFERREPLHVELS